MTKLEKVIKELRWLQFNFPWQDNPENDADKMSNAIHKYTGDAIELLESQQWISVKDRLPEVDVDVLTIANVTGEHIAMVDCITETGSWLLQGGDDLSQVTHWRYLPEPPKEEL